DSGAGDDGSGRLSDYFVTDESGPDRQTVAAEFSAIVAECMAQLSGPQREILNLRVAQGQTYSEMAEELGVRVGTAKSRVARARQALRKLLTEVCPEFRRGEKPEAWFGPLRPANGISAMRV
ncbi:MAG: sigma-70 family RNA polymerase sigma factor, partial [Lacunisphaera sp.]